MYINTALRGTSTLLLFALGAYQNRFCLPWALINTAFGDLTYAVLAPEHAAQHSEHLRAMLHCLCPHLFDRLFCISISKTHIQMVAAA